MTLEQAYNIFILSREEYCTEHTVFNYKHTLTYFNDFMILHKGKALSEIDIDSIDKNDLSAYTIYLRERPKYEKHPFSKKQDKPISKRSIKTYQTDVRAFFNYLYNEEYMKEQITLSLFPLPSRTKI